MSATGAARRPATRPRVVLDLRATQSHHNRERGIGRYCLDLVGALARRHRELVHRILVDPALPPPPGLGALDVAVSTDLDIGDGTIFHAMSPFEPDVAVPALWPRAASRRGLRLVVTVYDLIPEVLAEVYLADPGQRRRYRARRELVRAADHVVTISESATTDLIERWGLPAGDVTTIGAAPSPAFVPAADRAAAAAAAGAEIPALGRRYVLCNSAIEPRKNVERLVDAYAALPAAVRDTWQLVLACRLDPLERNHLALVGRRLGVEERLVLLGFVPDPLLRLLVQGADLAVLPSLYEGYGLPLAEAWACATPAIASATSAMVELVAAEATFDPTDPASMTSGLQEALTDPGRRRALEAWAAQPPPRWDGVADRLAEVYRRLALRPGPAAPPHRPRLALVAPPVTPSPSAPATYGARLAGSLAAHVTVDVYADGGRGDGGGDGREPDGIGRSVHPSPRSGSAEPPVRPGRQVLRSDALLGGYDAIVVCLDHASPAPDGLRALRQATVPVCVLAHDTLRPAADPEGRLVREVAGLARRLLVTSEADAEAVRAAVDPGHASRIGVWPYAYPPVVRRDPAGIDAGLLCSFGPLDGRGRAELLVDALAVLVAGASTAVIDGRPARPVRLALVGPAPAERGAALAERAARLGLPPGALVIDAGSPADTEGWRRRAAVAVQVAGAPAGGIPPAVADCLAYGVPTVVTASGALADLGAAVAGVPADVDARSLAARLGALLADRTRREALGGAGQAHAAGRGFDWAAGLALEVVPGLADTAPGPPGASP